LNLLRLKHEILKRALRGELLPRDESHYSVPRFSKQIGSEQSNFNKVTMAANDNNYFRAQETFLEKYELPQGWSFSKLGDIATFITRDYHFRKDNNFREQIGHEYHQGNHYFTEKYISPSGVFVKGNFEPIVANSVIMTNCAPVGMVNINTRAICIGKRLCAIAPAIGITVDLIFYWLMAFRDYFIERQKGTTVKHITLNDVKSLIVPVPPPLEQPIITARLDYLFSIINSIETVKNELTRISSNIKANTLSLAVRGILTTRDSNEESARVFLETINPFNRVQATESSINIINENNYRDAKYSFYNKLPIGWALASLKKIAKITRGRLVSPVNLSNNPTGYEFHQGKTYFTDKYLAVSGIYAKTPPVISPANSVLLSAVGNLLGDVNITDREIGIGSALWVIYPFAGISPEFIFYWLTYFKDYFKARQKGSTIKYITNYDVNSLVLPLPPLAEQTRILKKINDSFSLTQKMDSILSRL
jgi:type I restriction enzyme S subunit